MDWLRKTWKVDKFTKAEVKTAIIRFNQIQKINKKIFPIINVYKDKNELILEQKIIRSFKNIDYKNKLSTVHKLSKFINLIHKNNIVHGDLCFSNLGITKDDKLLIFDWELILSFKVNKNTVLRSSHLAIHPQDLVAKKLTKKSDYFTFLNLVPQILLDRFNGLEFVNINKNEILKLCSEKKNINILKNKIVKLIKDKPKKTINN